MGSGCGGGHRSKDRWRSGNVPSGQVPLDQLCRAYNLYDEFELIMWRTIVIMRFESGVSKLGESPP